MVHDATQLMRVLLAEDEKKVAQHIRAALREQGFTVDMYHRGDEALDAALCTPYDARFARRDASIAK
jgi:DNA-binding response OmpR family regulator